MTIELKMRNIVLVASHKPMDFDRYSLIKGGIVADEDILPQSNFSDQSVNLLTQNFQLVIFPNQIILAANNPESNFSLKDVFEKLLTISKTDPTGLGINFHWHFSEENKPLSILTKELFYDERIPILSKYFSNNDASFGLYASTDYRESRLKLDIKPISIPHFEDSNLVYKEVVNFQYNFHFDIYDDLTRGSIAKWIKDYEHFQNLSREITFIYKQK